VDLDALAHEVIQDLEVENNGRDVEWRVRDMPLVKGDPSMLRIVLYNLMSNALKFTRAGDAIIISAWQDEQSFQLAIADTGIGISEEGKAKLFRIDTQYTNPGTSGEKGTGLGLSLCKELVERNGGTIWVESELDKGTTFRFTLPRNSK
jgi:signal transduction histidine kinase